MYVKKEKKKQNKKRKASVFWMNNTHDIIQKQTGQILIATLRIVIDKYYRYYHFAMRLEKIANGETR